MGGKSGGNMEVNRYLMSIHVGLAIRVDAVLAAFYGEKKYWEGEVTTNTDIAISQTGLFGGDTKEGGVEGTMSILMGGADQVLPDTLAQKLGRQDGADCPGFRGVTSIFHTGPASEDRPGWLWCANSPYLKTLWYKVRRIPRAMGQEFVMIGPNDVNPSHIIFDALVNTEYGLGMDPAGTVDTASFIAAAKVLHEEELGLSLTWSSSTEAQTFINEILDHINGVIFSDPTTGRIVLKLIRDDYDVATLRSVSPVNATMTQFSRKAWGDTINEINVSWTDPESEQEVTVTLQDNGNIAEQGELVSDAKNYRGVRNADLAWRLAARDLRVASAPLCSAELQLNREFWNIKPGDCLKVSWPEYGMVDLVMRVWEVKYGSGRRGSSKISVAVTEDIFSLPVSAFVKPPSSEWQDPSRSPEAITVSKVFTLPIYMASKIAGASASTFEYPVAYAGVLGAAPNRDTFSFNLLGQSLNAAGQSVWESRGTRVISGHGALLVPLSAESESVVSEFNVDSGSGPAPSVFVMIGNGSEAAVELALVTNQTGSAWNLKRGILDTVPREWPTGTQVWFIRGDFIIADETQQSAGSVPSYKLLANTSLGELTEAAAPILAGGLTDRMHAPLRPANVKVAGVGFGEVDPPENGQLVVTWSRRNRLTEENVVLGWTDNDVTPEAGQITRIKVTDLSGAQIVPPVDSTSTSATVDLSAVGDIPQVVIVKASSVREGLESIQHHAIRVRTQLLGVVFVRAGSQVLGTTKTSMTSVLPSLSGVEVVNAALFMLVMHRSTVTPPSGWVLVATVSNPGSGATQTTSVYQKADLKSSDSGASSTWGFALVSNQRQGLQAVLVKSNEPGKKVSIVEALTGFNTNAANSFAAPSVTSDGAGRLALMVCSSYLANISGSTTYAAPENSTMFSPENIAENRLAGSYRRLALGQSVSGNWVSGKGDNYYSAVTILLSAVDI